ncbi:MAG TPA: SUF system Fe-S cluster assembly regulator [Burkholderiales bacterium]|nr:SUF system Fe-S cluster assembly regulator [Burkholderiales bacterium]
MLRMSKLADYGTVVMTYIALAPEKVHSAHDIASRVHVGLPTVSKILKILARQELLVSVRGAKGGYTLARPARKISIAEIIDAMEGPVGLTECSSAPGLCVQESSCSIRANWQKINRAVRRALETMSLAEMARPIAHPVRFDTLRAPAASRRAA